VHPPGGVGKAARLPTTSIGRLVRETCCRSYFKLDAFRGAMLKAIPTPMHDDRQALRIKEGPGRLSYRGLAA
jgi:hypothetical protein